MAITSRADPEDGFEATRDGARGVLSVCRTIWEGACTSSPTKDVVMQLTQPSLLLDYLDLRSISAYRYQYLCRSISFSI